MRLSNLLVNSSLLIGLALVVRNIFLRSHASLATQLTRSAPDDEAYIRELAHQIWESEGWPEGQAERHWDMAVKLSNSQDGDRE